jgi:hypothetical protein
LKWRWQVLWLAGRGIAARYEDTVCRVAQKLGQRGEFGAAATNTGGGRLF